MQIPSYGAAPLSATFLIVRGMEVISMLTVIALTANFVNDMVMANGQPPQEVIGTLAVTCLATLYTLVSIAFFWAEAKLGLLIMTGIDGLILIAFIVIATTFGKPVSYFPCQNIANRAASAATSSANAAGKGMSLALDTRDMNQAKWIFFDWAHTSKANCFETKAVWGLCIALCLLFTTSMFLLPTLFMKNKKANTAPKDLA
ncbi:hypothetical protein K402DRAFT_417678 [Aulographum hederae CBS 113979]|uniref:MARVEL domain-containing protein n=1 Tax=Aulographum hederae CBS 113979 TaxID=1176131 RepID=A0A6G1HAG1_9PEZI|nr:hypothetical protein K402DRAFT_417678 [Aulographum hederae CBS 113979]